MFRLVLLAVIIGLGYVGCTRVFSIWEMNASDAHSKARGEFTADLPERACLEVEDVRHVAEARNWDLRDEPAFHWCVAPDNVHSWLRVAVEPALPFSTEDENAAIFAFDAKGCAIAWEYASGSGSTCPD